MVVPSRRKSIVELTLFVLSLVLLGYILNFKFLRLDLTSEKRYTLSNVTKSVVSDLDDVVFVKVYLDGDLPIGFKRMQRALKETLDEFRVFGPTTFHYEFIDPSVSSSKDVRDAELRHLHDLGLEPTNVQERNPKGGTTQRIIFPGAIVNYKGREAVVNLLNNNPALSGDENINISIQEFEFKLISKINRLKPDVLPKLAFVHGHGQLDELETGDIVQDLSQQFEVHRVILGGEVGGLDPYAVVIMAGPTKKVPESDKLVLDQYIMGGGKVLWFIDGVNVSIDSLSHGATTLAFPNQHNLDDILFRYGARVNYNLIQDMQCAVIPINIALEGQTPRFAPAPWVYFPLLNAPDNNPITRNLNLIKSQFASTVDTVGLNPEVSKRFLLRTSDYSRLLNVPLYINLRQIESSPLERDFNLSFLPVAALLEGIFPSAFTNRPLASFNNGHPFQFRDHSIPTQMIVVSDADIIRNDVSRRGDGAYISPLGYDRYTNQTFGNKELVLNMVNYLYNDSELINLRGREFKLRLLDRKAILESRVKWQIINLTLPPLILLAIGAAWLFIRRRRHAT
ncbi:MAG: gliding motility-associated ABC transporter substrate-binding protein GldG [Bacteroidales bacterium]|nr:gliding motility-associated ABC transporter substrate-binding protein GldG [Bacteroidales bacterium]